jgi:hypothetical protein
MSGRNTIPIGTRATGWLLACTLAAALIHARPAAALFHAAAISEVLASYGGDASQQYVEVTQDFIFQNLVSNSVLAVFDQSGTLLDDWVIPSDVPNDGAGVPWIMATSAFQTAHGFTADFTIPAAFAGLPLGGGMVCWGAPVVGLLPPADPNSWDHADPTNYVDCVAYGSYAGPNNFPMARLGATPVQVIVPLVLPEGHSLTRVAETADNAASFACGAPLTPANNTGGTATLAATTPCPVCGNGVREEAEECDGSDDAACPGLCQVACACPAPAVPTLSAGAAGLLVVGLAAAGMRRRARRRRAWR